MMIFDGYGLPDLYIMDIYAEKDRYEGDSVSIYATIKNIGPGDADKVTEAIFYWGNDPDGGILIDDPARTSELKSGEDVTVQAWGTWPGGNQHISVICDHAGILEECCESNWRCERFGTTIKTKDARADLNFIPSLFSGFFARYPLLSRLLGVL